MFRAKLFSFSCIDVSRWYYWHVRICNDQEYIKHKISINLEASRKPTMCVCLCLFCVCCLIKVPLKVFVEPIFWKWLLYTILFWRVGNNKFTKKQTRMRTYMLIACASLIIPGFFLASFLQRRRRRWLTENDNWQVKVKVGYQSSKISMNILQKLLSYQINARTSCI